MILCANPHASYISYQGEIEKSVLEVMRGNRYILGEQVAALENEFASYIGCRFAIGVANGTDALELALRALEIGAGDEVITVSHTAVATVAAIEAAGAIPVLVDVDPKYYTLNPDQLKEVITPKTRAIIAVHLYGQSADLDAIKGFCQENDLFLIEDGSQAHGARWDGNRVGCIGDIGCFSCYPTKNLGAIGDAGLVTTNDEQLASKIRMLREYGWRKRYISDIPGRNSRLDELQAAILRVKLNYLDSDNEKRRIIAESYRVGLTDSGVVLPLNCEKSQSVYHLYVIQIALREKLLEYLAKVGIQAAVHYPQPIHLQPAYRGRIKSASDMSVTEGLADRVLSLPMYPELSLVEVSRVVDAVRGFCADNL